MLAENFRSIPIHTTRMRELLTDPVLLAAIVCLRDEVTEMLRGEQQGFDFVKGFNNCIDTFIELSVPVLSQEPEPEPTWGIEAPTITVNV